MKPPVFQDSSGHCFAGDPDSLAPPRLACEPSELLDLRARGQITLTDQRWKRVKSGVVLYADRRFLCPGTDLISLLPGDLAFDDKAGVYLHYLPRREALSILAQWGDSLVRDANAHLRDRNDTAALARAFESAQRARFSAPPPEHTQLRIDAFVYAGAAFTAMKRPVERFLRDAARDFDPPTVDLIRQRIAARVAAISQRASTPDKDAMGPNDGGQVVKLRDPADRAPIRVLARIARPDAKAA